jgi:uncharacterized protein (TIGR02270 family)
MGLIWDIQAQHLDEAEFLLELWANANDSPRYTATKLRDGPEQRLRAHIEALLLGGEIVLERLLLPAVEQSNDEFRSAAAALTILHGAGLEACERVATALSHARPQSRRGLIRALQLSVRGGLVDWLARDLDQLVGGALASRLRVLTAHRVDAGQRVLAWLEADDLDVRRAAAELARHTNAPAVLHRLHPLFEAEDAELRWAAIESGIIRSQLPAWHAAGRLAFEPGSRRRRAALAWLAMLGDDGVHHRILAALESAPTPALLWAGGLSGRPRAVDVAIDLLDHPRLARPAGELVCAVTGLDRDDNRYWLDRGRRIGDDPDEALPPLIADDLDHEPVPRREDLLRRPNPDAQRAWWSQHRAHFDPCLRYLAGRPFDLPRLAQGLAGLPTMRRHPLALELAARSGGRAQISTHVLTSVQASQADAIFSRLDSLELQRGLPLDR